VPHRTAAVPSRRWEGTIAKGNCKSLASTVYSENPANLTVLVEDEWAIVAGCCC